MSCMMSSTILLSTLAEALASILNSGLGFCGFEAPRSLYDALDGCHDRGFYSSDAIFRRLYALNMAAYNGRYRQNSAEIFEGERPQPKPLLTLCGMVSVKDDRGYSRGLYEIRTEHYKLLKALDFFTYQCAEDATRAHALQLALNDLIRVIRWFIIDNTPEYAALGWGEV